jgi:hypothetical protein
MDLLRTLWLAIAISGCVPDVDLDESILGDPRVLAIRAEPAEVEPGETIRWRALYADANGAIEPAPLGWSFCVARKPLAELGPIAPVCLGGEMTQAIGEGVEVEGAIPRDTCRLFGPEPPPPLPDQPPGRPVDPDASGGYYQPILVSNGGLANEDIAFFEQRIACGLAGATQQQAAEFTRRYRRNTSPEVLAFELVRGGEAIALGDAPIDLSFGEEVTLRVRWPECPREDACGDGSCGIDETRAECAEDCTIPRGCGGAERTLRFDAEARELREERESMRVAWYTSAGALELERTGVAADDEASFSENVFTAPSEARDVVLIAVLRDSRGAAGWATGRLRAAQ